METKVKNKEVKSDAEKCPVDLLVITLKEFGFNETHRGEEGDIILSDGKVRVGIFPVDFPHPDWCNRILADQEVNFDKWSKHFYRSDYPEDALSVDLIIADIKYLVTEINIKASNRFGHLFRVL